MKKKVLILCLLVFCLFAGCTRKYGSSDIKDYVKDKYGLAGFKVGRTPKEATGEDDLTDYVWTVTEDNGRVFHVLDNYYYVEWAQHNLHDDRNSIILEELYEQVQPQDFRLDETVDEEMVHAFLYGEYEDRDDLHVKAEALKQFYDQRSEDFSLAFDIACMHPYRTIGDYESTEADMRSTLIDTSSIDDALKEAEKSYLYLCLDHRYANMDEFSKEEIQNALEGYDYRLAHRNEDGEYEFYEDLVMSGYGYGVSFGGLYEVVKAEGWPIDGDPHHYSFTAPDGSIYEFSYDFKENNAYYYLKDGETVMMDYWFYDHFNRGRLKELFGLDLMAAYELE